MRHKYFGPLRPKRSYLKLVLLVLVILVLECILVNAYLQYITKQVARASESPKTPPDAVYMTWSEDIDPCSLNDVICDNEIQATVFAYTAIQALTDSTPCITASGYNACIGTKKIVANNCLEFGTKVTIQGIDYEVQDRMNERYGCKDFDILMDTYEEAKQWGVKELEISHGIK